MELSVADIDQMIPPDGLRYLFNGKIVRNYPMDLNAGDEDECGRVHVYVKDCSLDDVHLVEQRMASNGETDLFCHCCGAVIYTHPYKGGDYPPVQRVTYLTKRQQLYRSRIRGKGFTLV